MLLVFERKILGVERFFVFRNRIGLKSVRISVSAPGRAWIVRLKQHREDMLNSE